MIREIHQGEYDCEESKHMQCENEAFNFGQPSGKNRVDEQRQKHGCPEKKCSVPTLGCVARWIIQHDEALNEASAEKTRCSNANLPKGDR